MKTFITVLFVFSCLSVLGHPVYLRVKPHVKGSSNIAMEETPVTEEMKEETPAIEETFSPSTDTDEVETVEDAPVVAEEARKDNPVEVEKAIEDTPVVAKKAPELKVTLQYMDGTTKEISVPYGEIKSFTIN